MNPTLPAGLTQVPFPLYHGSSTHYLANFRPGEALSDWPHARDALDLYRQIWTELRSLGHALEWWQERILAQDSAHANWQHGQLYVTPSMISAVRYAGGGAAHGGELLQSCRDALDRLWALDPARSAELQRDAGTIACCLEDTGQPILIEFSNVQVCGLSPERPSDDVSVQLSILSNLDERMRELMGQQCNFRLTPGCAIVGRVFELSINDVGDPLSHFQLREIVDSDQ